ncbi:exlusion protein FxsA [Rhodobacteraceae bacterium WD3A24]|nr:exlusion protein FxsA [Rhodobacteraceae bacterium WD3A24]
MWLFVLLVVLPLVEIALFVTVGGWLTLWPTLALVILGGVAGLAIIRLQGQRTPAALREALDRAQDPARPLVDSALVMIGALLLILPGFFTDTLGLLLLLPPVRAGLRTLAARHGSVHVAGGHHRRGPGRPGNDDIIEGEYEVSPDDEPAPKRPTHLPESRTRH